jgi:hypothetical protein
MKFFGITPAPPSHQVRHALSFEIRIRDIAQRG